jgi:peptidoglycan/LPS O-acetylase OafA/YrhL
VLGYVSNWARVYNWPIPTGLEHTWSLSVEEQFYIVWPTILLVFLRWRRAKHVLGLCISVFVVGYLIQTYSNKYSAGSAGVRYFQPQEKLVDLMSGTTLALVLQRGWQPPKWMSRFGLFALFMVCAFTLPAGYVPSFNEPWVYSVGMACIIAGSLESGSLLYRFLASPVARWTGRLSYSLYLWHYLLFYAIANEFSFISQPNRVLIGWPLAFAVACLSYYLVEMPFLRLKRRFEPVERRPTTGRHLTKQA